MRKVSNKPFLIQTHVPSNGDIILSKTLLQLSIIIAFDLDEWAKYVLVLVGIFVSQQDRLRFALAECAVAFQVIQGGYRVLLPHLLKPRDFSETNGLGADYLLFVGDLDEPGQELAIFDQR